MTERLYSRFVFMENVRNRTFSLYIGKGIAAREIIRAPFEKADTEDYFAVFPPLSPQFLERLER